MELSTLYRERTLDRLSEDDIGKVLKVAGWVENIRDHGGVSFIDLRDMYGVLQVVMRDTSYVHPESDAHIHMQIFRTNISSLALMSAVPPDLPLHDLRIFKASRPSPSQSPCS